MHPQPRAEHPLPPSRDKTFAYSGLLGKVIPLYLYRRLCSEAGCDISSLPRIPRLTEAQWIVVRFLHYLRFCKLQVEGCVVAHLVGHFHFDEVEAVRSGLDEEIRRLNGRSRVGKSNVELGLILPYARQRRDTLSCGSTSTRPAVTFRLCLGYRRHNCYQDPRQIKLGLLVEEIRHLTTALRSASRPRIRSATSLNFDFNIFYVH